MQQNTEKILLVIQNNAADLNKKKFRITQKNAANGRQQLLGNSLMQVGSISTDSEFSASSIQELTGR